MLQGAPPLAPDIFTFLMFGCHARSNTSLLLPFLKPVPDYLRGKYSSANNFTISPKSISLPFRILFDLGRFQVQKLPQFARPIYMPFLTPVLSHQTQSKLEMF
jgi:hypothetical protein